MYDDLTERRSPRTAAQIGRNTIVIMGICFAVSTIAQQVTIYFHQRTIDRKDETIRLKDEELRLCHKARF